MKAMYRFSWFNIFYPFLCGFLLLHAQTPDSLSGKSAILSPELKNVSRVEYEMPFYDAPYNNRAFPSMVQSLALTKDVSQGIHWAFARFASRTDNQTARLVRSLGFGLSEIALISFPGGYSWLHEEWHRAVLSNHGITSFNGVYDFRILSSVVPVSHVADTSLIVLKRDHPSAMVRLSAAGNEGQIELVRSLRKELFFNRQECALDWITLFINTFSPASYVFLCSLPYADQLTTEMQKAEGTDVGKRDIVGMDFTAWVYDLYRPDTPYSARGIHPSGVGINRYIKRSQLTGDEKSYLQLQGFLAWLNLLNPQLAMKNRFSGKNPFTGDQFFWNAALVHELTPFGFLIDCDVMARTEKNASASAGLAVTLHSYFNRSSYYPGAVVEIDDLPISIAKGRIYLSGQIEAWLQPSNHRFDDRSANAGGSAAVCIKTALTRNLLVTVTASGKSAGWKAGQVSLERDYSAAFGLSLWLPNRQK